MDLLRRLLLVIAALSYGAMPFGVQAQPAAQSVAIAIAQQHDQMLPPHKMIKATPIHTDHQGDMKRSSCFDHNQGRTNHFGAGCCQCTACLVLPVALQGIDGKPVVGGAPLPSAARRLSSRSHLPPLPPPRFL